jgi:hypothetical protein
MGKWKLEFGRAYQAFQQHNCRSGETRTKALRIAMRMPPFHAGKNTPNVYSLHTHARTREAPAKVYPSKIAKIALKYAISWAWNTLLYHFDQLDSHVSQPSVFCLKSVPVTGHRGQCLVDPTSHQKRGFLSRKMYFLAALTVLRLTFSTTKHLFACQCLFERGNMSQWGSHR